MGNGVNFMDKNAERNRFPWRIRRIIDTVRSQWLYPDSVPKDGPLKRVMALKSRVVQLKEFPKGAAISYGRTFTAEKPLTCAVICAGYADGLPRRLSSRFEVCINGRFYPQVGRVCMDMCMVDVSDGGVHRGDEVTLFGAPGISVERAAAISGTINYELTCLVTPRVRRVYQGC